MGVRIRKKNYLQKVRIRYYVLVISLLIIAGIILIWNCLTTNTVTKVIYFMLGLHHLVLKYGTVIKLYFIITSGM